MVEVLLEIIFELLLQIGGEVLFEVGLRRLGRYGWTQEAVTRLLALIVYFGLGAIAGVLTLIPFPRTFVRSTRWHGISLIITPLIAGLTMTGIGRLRQWQGQAVMRLDTFGYAFVFAFGMALMRFLLAI